MPSVDDWSPDDDENADAPSGGGGIAPGGGGGSQPANNTPSPQREPAFVPWDRFVTANQDVSQREAGKLKQGVQGQVNRATQSREAAQGAQEKAIQSNYKPAPPEPTFGNIASQPKTDKGFGIGKEQSQGAQQGMQQYAQARQPPQPAAPPPAPDMKTRTMAGPRQPQMMGIEPAKKVVDPDKLKTSIDQGTWKTAGDGLAGGKNLESQVGSEAWNKLIAQTMQAQESASALGDEGGIEALLDQQGPATAFDAALIGGAGGKDFRDLSERYGGDELHSALVNADKGAQGNWAKLMGDVNAASSARDAEIQAAQLEKDRLDAVNAAGEGGETESGGPGWRPEGFTDLDSFINAQQGSLGGGYEDTHTASQYLSPADWLTRGIGEAGGDIGMASELFSGAVAGDMAPDHHWKTANVREGMRTVMHEYGMEALQKLWDSMTPEMWAAYMELGNNPGRVAREMRAWLESAGYTKKPREPKSEITSSDETGTTYTTGDGQTETTTAEEETARTDAYNQGWGTEYDTQFRNGNRKPVNPNG